MFRLVTDILYMEGKHCIDLMTIRFGSDRSRRKISARRLFSEFRSERLDRELDSYLP